MYKRPANQQAALIEVLKRLMHQGKHTYSDCAKVLGLSLPAVKKMFAHGDMTISRLEHLCQWLHVTIKDLSAQAAELLSEPVRFTKAQETFFANNPTYLAYYFQLSQDRATPDAIAKKHQLTTKSTQRYLAKLEALGLISTVSGTVEFTHGTERRVVWDDHGPLGQTFSQTMMSGLLQHVMDHRNEKDSRSHTRLNGWRLSDDSYEKFKQELETLGERYSLQSRLTPTKKNSQSRYYSFMAVIDEFDAPIFQEIKNL